MNGNEEAWNNIISFHKIYVFCFTDINGMLNKSAKQNIVNSIWREDLKGCTYTRSETNVRLKRLYIYKI